MTRDLGTKSYFRITVRELEHLARTDFVTLTLPQGGLTIPVGVLVDRFATSKSWLNKGEHASSTFPQWLADYLQGGNEPRLEASDIAPNHSRPPTSATQTMATARKSGVSDGQRTEIRKALDAFVANLSESLEITPKLWCSR
jgi:hypothetical protein